MLYIVPLNRAFSSDGLHFPISISHHLNYLRFIKCPLLTLHAQSNRREVLASFQPLLSIGTLLTINPSLSTGIEYAQDLPTEKAATSVGRRGCNNSMNYISNMHRRLN